MALLQDQLLLGMEILHQQKARLDLEDGTMGKEAVPMTFGRPVEKQEAQVSLIEIVQVLVASVILCPCHLDRELKDFVMSPDIANSRRSYWYRILMLGSGQR